MAESLPETRFVEIIGFPTWQKKIRDRPVVIVFALLKKDMKEQNVSLKSSLV